MEIPEEEKREKRNEKAFETIMTENFIKLMPGTKQHMQETQRTPSRQQSKTSTLRHIIVKLQKIKDKGKILKEGRGKKNTTFYKRR